MDKIFLMILIASVSLAIISFFYILINYRDSDTDTETVTVNSKENREIFEKKIETLFHDVEFMKKKKDYSCNKTGTDH